MTKNEDTKAILARRDAFIKNVLSNDEAEEVKGGALATCVIPTICLSIAEPCLSIVEPCLTSCLTTCVTACFVGPQPCLTIAEIDDPIMHDIDEPILQNKL